MLRKATSIFNFNHFYLLFYLLPFMNRITTLALFFYGLLLSGICFGQTEARQKAIREKMWQGQDIDFKQTQVPDKWKNESAVILCRNMEYQVKKEVFLTYVYENLYTRNRIKLLDQAAVKEFSEMSFEASKNFVIDVFGSSNSADIFVGIKVIKPNGQEREITLKDAVTMEVKEGYSKEKYNKIAIPNLEPGDIIDYYYCIEKSTVYGDFDRILYSFASKHPIVKQKLDVHIMRKCYINAKSLNGAPVLARNPLYKNEDVFSLVDENREKVNTDQNWFLANRSLPTINFRAYYVPKKVGWMDYFLGKQGEVNGLVTADNLLNYVNMVTGTMKAKNFLPSVSMIDFVKTHTGKEKNPEVIAREGYDYIRQKEFATNYEDDILNNRGYRYGLSNYEFSMNMVRFLKKNKIDHDLIVTTHREISDMKDLVLLDDMDMLIRINGSKPFYITQLGGFTHYNEIAPSYQGANGYAVNMLKKGKQRSMEKIILPVDAPEVNADKTELEVSLLPEQNQGISIKRKVCSAGANRFAHMRRAVTPYDYLYDSKAEKYSIQLLEKQSLKKKQKVETETKIAQKKEQDSKDRMEGMKAGIEEEYSGKVSAYHTFDLLQTGLWSDKPEIIYEDAFILEGLLASNGPNYLLDAGKLISKQIDLSKEELSRKEDIYMPYARTFMYTINIAIPQGFEVKGVEKFNVNVTNATGGFISSASVEGNKVVITTKKYYAHNFEKAENWKEVTAFLEASYDFTQQKLLFRKAQIGYQNK